MAYDKITRSFREGKVYFQAGAGGALFITVDEGDLNWTETRDVKEVIYRGDPTNSASHPMTGNVIPSDVSMTLRVTEFYTGLVGGNAAPYEMLTNFNSTQTTRGSDGEEYQVQVSMTIDDPGTGAVKETIQFQEFVLNGVTFQEGDDYSTMAITGRNFSGPPSIGSV